MTFRTIRMPTMIVQWKPNLNFSLYVGSKYWNVPAASFTLTVAGDFLQRPFERTRRVKTALHFVNLNPL